MKEKVRSKRYIFLILKFMAVPKASNGGNIITQLIANVLWQFLLNSMLVWIALLFKESQDVTNILDGT